MKAGPAKERILIALYAMLRMEDSANLRTLVLHPHFAVHTVPEPDKLEGLHVVDYLQLARTATEAYSVETDAVLLSFALKLQCATLAVIALSYGSNNEYTCLLVWLLTKLKGIGAASCSPQLLEVERCIIHKGNSITFLQLTKEKSWNLCLHVMALFIELDLVSTLEVSVKMPITATVLLSSSNPEFE